MFEASARLRFSRGLALTYVLTTSPALAVAPQPGASAKELDAVDSIYWAPELGGPDAPHMLSVRELGFWAEVEALGEDGKGGVSSARQSSVAAERLMLEDLWAARQDREQPERGVYEALAEGLFGELVRRTGGKDRFDEVLERHGLSLTEVGRRMRERARALKHAESHFTRVRSVSESDLRSRWDAQQHPFVGEEFGSSRDAFAVWYRVETLRGLELEQLRASRRLVRVRALR